MPYRESARPAPTPCECSEPYADPRQHEAGCPRYDASAFGVRVKPGPHWQVVEVEGFHRARHECIYLDKITPDHLPTLDHLDRLEGLVHSSFFAPAGPGICRLCGQSMMPLGEHHERCINDERHGPIAWQCGSCGDLWVCAWVMPPPPSP
jgi:hypothetical protein